MAIENLNALDAIQLILQTTGLPICFESEELDPKTEGITARALKAELLGRAAAKTLRPGESSTLASLSEVEKEFPDSIVAWNVAKASGAVNGGDPSAVLAGFSKLYPGYETEVSNGLMMVFPKNSVLDFMPKPLSVKDRTLGEVLASIAPEFQQHGLTFVSLGQSGVLDRKISGLELAGVSARTMLARIVQAAGPDVVWFVGGMKGSRAVTISAVQPPH